MKRLIVLLALVAAVPAQGWEADSTHAGLSEQAALSSKVNRRLRALYGRGAGWLEPLSLLPDRAPALYQKLATIQPTSGVVPDRRGRQTALAWLVAGSVLEGMPGARDRNHFYDPVHKTGLTGQGVGGPLSAKIWGTLAGEPAPGSGKPAPDWIVAADNDLGLARFWLELERSMTAETRGVRDEHLAMALVCAGAMMHVLEDMGVPAHARDDLREHLLPLGAGNFDRGSRFERLAAILDGRLGVPAPVAAPPRSKPRDFFTAADGLGLADVTNSRWYSMGTLPAEVVAPADPARGEVQKLVARAQRFPSPRPLRDLDLGPPPGPDGQALRDDDGVCLANYRVEDGRLGFAISDTCAAEQLAVILPLVGGYAQGFLDWLFRGALLVTVEGGNVNVSVAAPETQLGQGKLTLVGEDAEGRRRVISSADWSGPAGLAVPDGVVRVFAVFRGTDANGEELVAVGSASL